MAERNKDKKKYVPPEITRVVLRSEQAILSPCSANTVHAFEGLLVKCAADFMGEGGCKKTGGGDDAADS